MIENTPVVSGLCKELSAMRPANIESLLEGIALLSPLFDALPDTVFFIKDVNARYLAANMTLASRCGFKNVAALFGRTSADIFPRNLGALYLEQDRHVLRYGVPIRDQLELHLDGDRKQGWCLTHKLPLLGQNRQIVGIAGISSDLHVFHHRHPIYRRLAAVDLYIQEHYYRSVRLSELTTIADMSVAQLERYYKRVFHVTPRQMIRKVRLEHAYRLLTGEQTITEIAQQCGYADHSAFTRQFKMMTGITPRQYRQSAFFCGAPIDCQ